jgi:hypothetical protein
MSGNHHHNRVSEHFADEAVGVAERGYEAVQDAIQKEPMAITLAAFGIGLAVGTAAAVLMTRSSRKSHQTSMESLGRRVYESLADALPESVRQHLPR